MIPFADSLYFSILIYPALAAILLGLLGRLSWRWVVAINLAMLAVQYSGFGEPTPQSALGKLPVLAGYALFEWGLAAVFLRVRRHGKHPWVFRAVVLLALAPLAVVKLMPLNRSPLGFLGISYVTFRSLDVVIGIQDWLIESLSPWQYLTYVLFFPTVSSGPIDRYNRFLADFVKRRTRQEFLQDLDGAVQRFFRGLLYKFIVSVLIEQYWLGPLSKRVGLWSTVSYMYAYTFNLFFDLAGYSAFAIAFGYLFGIHTPENFDRPFLARNIVDFWNRWHISLSTWFRDHVYMRFLMAAMKGRWFSNRLVVSSLGFYLSFGLMGLWHGVSPRYVIYGLYHATLLAGYTVLADARKRRPSAGWHIPWNVAGPIVTFHLIAFGLLIFSGRLG